MDMESFEALFRGLFNMMPTADASSEWMDKMKSAYKKDVAILPPAEVASIIEAGGFETTVQFFQAGLIHSWFARCVADNST
jgi:tRNA (cmo5U34)-methyltransferase